MGWWAKTNCLIVSLIIKMRMFWIVSPLNLHTPLPKVQVKPALEFIALYIIIGPTGWFIGLGKPS